MSAPSRRRRSGPGARGAGLVLSALLALGVSPAVATATTVGGRSTFAAGPIALAAGRLFTPTFATNNLGEATPGPGPPVTETTTALDSFSAAKHSARTSTLDDSTMGAAVPALAADRSRVAVAWIGLHGLQTALVAAADGSLSSPPLPVTSSGAPTGYTVAVDSTGARAVMWLDALGIRVQTVSTAAVAAPALTLAPGTSAYFSIVSDDAGGWWALWIAAKRVLAVHIAADGTTSPSIDVAAAPTRSLVARLLYPVPWTTVADGSGGLWAGFANGLVHVAPTGVSQRRAAHGVTLAPGDGATTLAESAGAGAIELRPLGRPGHALRLRHLGSLLDLAYDPSKHATRLLTAAARGRVELTSVSRRGQVSTLALRACPAAGSGEVASTGGLVAIACAGRSFEAESVETGGDFVGGRHIHYYLLRNGKVLRGESVFEGEHDY